MNPLFAAPAVCNTGPLIALARVEMAGLPFQLFPDVFVPEEVRPYLDGMIQGGYYIGPNLFAACLSAAGEQQ